MDYLTTHPIEGARDSFDHTRLKLGSGYLDGSAGELADEATLGAYDRFILGGELERFENDGAFVSVN